MKRERLLLITVIMLALAFVTSTGILVYYVTHAQDLSASVQNSVQAELKKYNLSAKNVSVDDSKVILSIARYCEANDGCRGPRGIAGIGIQGPQGVQGIQGSQGVQGLQGQAGADGRDGVDGKDGEPGPQGPAGPQGEPGPKTERRCNAQEHRMEWRNEGDENWQVEYYLSPLQSCP